MISISVTADKYSRNVLSVLYMQIPLFSTKYMINQNMLSHALRICLFLSLVNRHYFLYKFCENRWIWSILSLLVGMYILYVYISACWIAISKRLWVPYLTDLFLKTNLTILCNTNFIFFWTSVKYYSFFPNIEIYAVKISLTQPIKWP
jgi:hypothetical protein